MLGFNSRKPGRTLKQCNSAMQEMADAAGAAGKRR